MKISYYNILQMSLLSVPLSPEMESKINKLVKQGVAHNKADLARKAIEFFIEEQAVASVLKSEKEADDGKLLKGDLDVLAKRL